MAFGFAPLVLIAVIWIVSCFKVVNEYERLVGIYWWNLL
jgi:regulator of protease activity HflC (stomatin/prohibitin superfamily)